MLQRRTRLSNWSSEYPLLIGNELTGDRAWRGRVFALDISDAATTPAAVRRFSAGEPSLEAGTPIAAFDFTGSAPFKDATGHLPDLEWTGRPRASDGAGGSCPARPGCRATAPHQVWRSVCGRRARSPCSSDARPTIPIRTARRGLSRILPARCCETSRWASRAADLVFRLRTPDTGVNGYPLEVFVPGVFADRSPREILVTYDGANLLVAMAHGDDVSRTELTPGGSVAAALPSLNVRADELQSVPAGLRRGSRPGAGGGGRSAGTDAAAIGS